MFLRIKKVLIANRSEIAARIIQTCKSLGIQTVAVYAPEDIQAPYIYLADEAICLESEGSIGFCNPGLLVSIALQTNCDAVHPGYGFLSEKEVFAAAVIDAGLIWIGPHPHAIEQAGNKGKAHAFAQELGIPVARGITCISDQLTYAQQQAEQLGYPLLIKCALGGGGKAMRVVHNAQEFESAWEIVTRESLRLFASDQLLLEQYIPKARHIEIQIAGDGTEIIHLFERECSVQRRNQKIIEEAPCNFVPQTVLQKLYDASIRIGKALQYDSVGTVEFLVTDSDDFYFLEVNTRLQVEHAVTEFITGIDLVWLQLQLAATKQLPFAQHQITQRGHAIQARLYAEDASANFMPSTGILDIVTFANHPFVRIDQSLEAGMSITPSFDPMIAKLIGWGMNRELARNNLTTALNQTIILGVTTNNEFLQNILSSQEFINGNIFTALLNNKQFMQQLTEHTSSLNDASSELYAIAHTIKEQQQTMIPPKTINPWKQQTWK